MLTTRSKKSSQRGFSIFEVVATMGLMSVMAGVSVMNLKVLRDPLKNGSEQLSAFFKQVRAKAVATTSAYTIVPTSSGSFITRYSSSCSDAGTTDDANLTTELPSGAYVTDTDWTLCYSPRGIADGNLTVEVRDLDGQYKNLEVFLGGAVRVS